MATNTIAIKLAARITDTLYAFGMAESDAGQLFFDRLADMLARLPPNELEILVAGICPNSEKQLADLTDELDRMESDRG